ncbi:MAG: helix-hairpin-helix domain-containing protein [Bacillota bacterium]|nr:helix-hairpin-helix domain-containing protein [Bacillota bacterium]
MIYLGDRVFTPEGDILIEARQSISAAGEEENSGEGGDEKEDFLSENMEEQRNIHNTIIVDIAGAIEKPGVYHLEEGSRLYQLIELAGGLAADADMRYLNRAAVLEDQQKIYIYTEDEAEKEAVKELSSAQGSEGASVNINTADTKALETLSGVGPSTAAKIIAYRQEYGPFKSIEEIKNVSGIGEKTFETIRDRIRVN